MIHVEWITPDDIVLNDGFYNKKFSEEVKLLKSIRLLKIGNNYYLRYEKEKLPIWVSFSFYKNNNIYFGNVQAINPNNEERIELDYKFFHREEVLKNILE